MSHHRVLLTGGGTGGHVYPAIAVAEQLRNCEDVEKILYVGVKGHLEERLAKQQGIEFVGIDVSGMPRRPSFGALMWPFKMMAAIRKAKLVTKLFRPTVVLGTGGYAAVPSLMAAKCMRIPYVIHEPDAYPGLSNRWFSNHAKLISLGMASAGNKLSNSNHQVMVNGNPVRESFLKLIGKDAACAVLGLDGSMKTVLITGGSQGAQAINDAVLGMLPRLLNDHPNLQIVHQVGEKNIADYKKRVGNDLLDNKRYCLRPYFEDLSVPYAAADLAICRAGAMTISELTVTGTPAVFIPFPYAAGDHQSHNAKFMASKGAAVVLPQSKLSSSKLYQTITELLFDGMRLSAMKKEMLALAKPNAAGQLAEQIKNLSSSFQKLS